MEKKGLGKVNWHFPTDSEIERPPTITASTAYFGDMNGDLYAVDVDSGTEQWHFSTDKYIQGSPVVVDGTVYFDSCHNYVHAVDAKTGEERWRYNIHHNGVHTEPAVVNGVVYLVAGSPQDQQIHAVTAESGDVLWTFELRAQSDDLGSICFPLQATDSTVYFMSDNGNLYAIDTESGDLQWSLDHFEVSSPVAYYPTVNNKNIYIGCTSGVYNIQVDDVKSSIPFLSDTGPKIKWSNEDGWFISPVVLSDGLVYVSELLDDSLYAFNTNGEIKWRISLQGNGTISAPSIKQNIVYITYDRKLIAYSSNDGSKIETVQIPSSASMSNSPPVIGRHNVYIGGSEGLYAINPYAGSGSEFGTGNETSQLQSSSGSESQISSPSDGSSLTCPECGQENGPDATFCQNSTCGTRLKR